MKKKQDGFYYEKEVDWDKHPRFGFLILGTIMLIVGILLSIAMGISGPVDLPELVDQGLLGTIDVVFLIIGAIFSLIGFMGGGVVLMILSIGKGKEVKYRRIGK